MVEPFANSGDPDLGLHFLPVTHLGVSSLQCVNYTNSPLDKILVQVFYPPALKPNTKMPICYA